VEIVELRFGVLAKDEPVVEKLLNKFEVTPPWNSWTTLAEANGCQATLADVNVVPTRTLRRPRVLSIALSVKIEGGTKPAPGARGGPGDTGARDIQSIDMRS